MLTMTPKGIDYDRLKVATTKEENPAPIGVVSDKDLVKVGGLYRIRDNYEAVWRMEAGEDGKRYIVRADDGGAETPERLAVSSDAPSQVAAQAALTVTAARCKTCGDVIEQSRDKHKGDDYCSEGCRDQKKKAAAYRVIRAGAVYVCWECESCATPNLTKYGNTYECDECHKRFANVLQEPEQRKPTYTRAEVTQHNPDYGKRMGKLGINIAHESLLQVWDREAKAECPKCKAGEHGKCSAQNCPCCGDREAAKAVNPWAVCHESVGPGKSDKFERCVKDVKRKSPIKKD